MAVQGFTPPPPPNRRWRAEPATDQRASHAHSRSRTRGVEILPPSLCQPLSLTSPSPGGSECASCASEKNKKLSEIRENYPPSLCAKFRNFSTRSGPAVSAPARGRRQNRHRRANWHLSCLPPTREAPRRGRMHRPALSPRPVAFPRRPPSRWKRRDLWEVAQGRGAHGARSPTRRRRPAGVGGEGENIFANIHRAMATIADIHHGNLAPPLPRPDAGGAAAASEGGGGRGALVLNPQDTPLRSANQAAPLRRPVAPCLAPPKPSQFFVAPLPRTALSCHLTPPCQESDLK